MLKTPAALLGLFRGDEMYVLKPQQHGHGNPSIRLDIPNPYTFVSDSLVEMVPIESSSYDGYVYLHYPNGEKVTFYISKYTPKPWPDLFMVPAGTKMSYTGRRHPLKSFRIYPLVPAKSVGGGRQHIDGSLRSTSLASSRIRSVHRRRRANYHTYKPYHSQCADNGNVHSEIPEVHVGDGRQNRRGNFLIRPLFRCDKGEKLLGGNGPSGSGVRGIAVASGMNLRGLRLKEAA